MLSTPELILALERRGVLPAGDLARVRQLYENSPTEFVPRVMFKWLVNRGRVTPEQAELLLAPELTPTSSAELDRILGVNDDLELQVDDDGEYDEDTKDMPVDAAHDLTLAPRGAPPFADSPTGTRPSLIPDQLPPPAATDASPRSTPAAPREPAQPARPAAAELLDELFSDAGPGALGPPLAARIRLPARKSRWESPLILVGGGALLLLVALGAFLLWRVGREAGDAAFAAAEQSYNEGGYAAAVERYDHFLADYPRHRAVGAATVHRGLARLRLAVEAGDDWPRTLEAAKSTLPEIAALPEFPASRADLAALLPDIAENLARSAAAADTADAAAPSVAQAAEARALIDKYVAANDALAPRLQQIDALIAAAQRRVARRDRIAATVAAIEHAAAARDLDEAARARARLLAEFPDAADEPQLAEAMESLAETKRQAVRYAALDEPAAAAPAPSPILRKVTPTDRRGEALTGVDDVFFAVIEGTLFAYDAADGRVRWTRHVGFDAPLPITVGDAAERDALFYDGAERALVRVAAADGSVRWRQPRAASPVFDVERDRVYVVLDRRLLLIDAADGGITGEVQFPTEPALAPTSDPRGRVRYQLGKAHDLFVVANDDFRCLQAYYVGHAAGAVAVPPTCVGSYVLLAENVGDQTRLRLLEAGGDGADLKQIAVRLVDGRTTLPLQVSQRLAAVVTNGGPVEVFDLSGAGDRPPLEPVARLAAGGDRIVRRHFVFRDGQLWLGGHGLTQYELRANLGRLTPLRTALEDWTTLQAPQLVPGAVVCRTQPSDFMTPPSVVAVDAAQGRVRWETSQPAELVAAPQPSADGGTVTCVTAAGLVYDIAADSPAVIDQPTISLGGPLSDFAPAATADGAHVFVGDEPDSPAQFLLTLEPPGAMPRFTRTKPLGEFTTAPTAYHGGVLIAAADRRLHLFDPRTGARLAEPFQPAVVDRADRLSQAVVVGDDALTYGAELYRLTVEAGDAPQLKVRATYDVAAPPAIAGTTAYIVTAADELTAYSTGDFRAGESWKFRSARDWQTTTIGGRLLAQARLEPNARREELLVCLTGDGKLAWQTTLERSPGAARYYPPLADGDDLLVVDEVATIVRLDGATGRETARQALDLPLGAPPIAAGDRLLLVTQAGELLWIAKP